jgi:hypothetical protein
MLFVGDVYGEGFGAAGGGVGHCGIALGVHDGRVLGVEDPEGFGSSAGVGRYVEGLRTS